MTGPDTLGSRFFLAAQSDFEEWFEANVKPTFPQGAALPSIAFDELHQVVTPW